MKRRVGVASESSSSMAKGCAFRRDPRPGHSKWITAKVFEDFRQELRGRAARICGRRIEADDSEPCFLRSFVLLAPRQCAMGFLCKWVKQGACQFANQAAAYAWKGFVALSLWKQAINCNVILHL